MILEMKDVTKRFPGVLALDKVNIDLREGEILGLCGENGAGKSTLMKVLSGNFCGDYEGEIYSCGKKIKMDSVETAQKLGIEMVYQEVNMMFDASVAENLFVGNLPGGNIVNFKKLYAKTEELLQFAHIEIRPKEKVRKLNNGQLQMLSILRAWSKEPKILVLDEPTGALTNKEVDILMNILEKLKERGVSCIYISHKLEEIFRITDRVIVLRDGKTVSSHLTAELTEKILIEEMVGRKIENLYPKKEVNIGEVVFEANNITVPHPTLKGQNIVENLSFFVRKGEILGLGGLVGSGRSETLAAIFGLETEGVSKRIFMEGKEVRIETPEDAIRAGIGFVTEERKQNGFVGTMTIRENISMVNLKYMPGRYMIDRKAEKESVCNIFARLHVKANSPETKVGTLSGGNQQKVVVGKWLLKEPGVLFIDEPTRGIDVGAKAEIYKILSELAERGIAIIMVSSDMQELIAMCDRCLVISGKRITGEFHKGEITQENIMEAAIR